MSVADMSWQTGAPCARRPELFFAPDDDERPGARDRREAEAIAICRPCPARADCLAWHLRTGACHGVAGGFGADALKDMRRRMLRRTAPDPFTPDAVRAEMTRADVTVPEGWKLCAGCLQPRRRPEFGPRRNGGYKYTSCTECREGKRHERKAAA